MKKHPLFFIFYLLIVSGCVAQPSQVEEYGWHSTSSVKIQTDCNMDTFYDDPLYYYHNEFDWLYLK